MCANGSRFVSKVLKGGVLFRRISFSSQDARTIDKLKARLSVWAGIGPFKVSFGVTVEMGLGDTASRALEVRGGTYRQ